MRVTNWGTAEEAIGEGNTDCGPVGEVVLRLFHRPLECTHKDRIKVYWEILAVQESFVCTIQN